MNYRNVGIGIIAILLITGGVWFFMISSYEEDLGTKNEFRAQDSANNLTIEKNNSLFDLSFSKSEEALEWSKLRISIDNGTERRTIYMHKARMVNLTSNSRYYYKVGSKIYGYSDIFTFKTAPDKDNVN